METKIISKNWMMIFIAFALLLAVSSAHAVTCNYISSGTYTTPLPAFTTNIALNWMKVSWISDVVINPTAATCADVAGTCSASCSSGSLEVIGATCTPSTNKCCLAASASVQIAVSTNKGTSWSSYLTSPSGSTISVTPNPSSNISIKAQLLTNSPFISPRLTGVTLYSSPRLNATQGQTSAKCWPTSVLYTCSGTPFTTKYVDNSGNIVSAGAITVCDSLGPNYTIVRARLNATDFTENNWTDNALGALNPNACSR